MTKRNKAWGENLSHRIEALAAIPAREALPPDAQSAFDALLEALEAGEVRAAEQARDGSWQVVQWVKRGILLGFRLGHLVEMTVPQGAVAGHKLQFFDKNTYPLRDFTLDDQVRIVPGGSSVRRGAYVAPGVVCMPPMYVNVGAYVGEGTMIDSHALVGSCAQIGARVHLSAGAQIGGVLEPVNASPVVIEDDVIVGGNCGVYEGTVVKSKAVLAAGVVLTRGTPVYDLIWEQVYRGTPDKPLLIPPGAVVVPGARAIKGDWARGEGLSLQTPVIVKYRDEKTDLATTLEAWLR
ncbi:MAG: 2,3,4,5-tetrahydropyridine-2,6-dicarboxylate N-succinyltransferase [Gemmatimonadaceae bacterium]